MLGGGGRRAFAGWAAGRTTANVFLPAFHTSADFSTPSAATTLSTGEGGGEGGGVAVSRAGAARIGGSGGSSTVAFDRRAPTSGGGRPRAAVASRHTPPTHAPT